MLCPLPMPRQCVLTTSLFYYKPDFFSGIVDRRRPSPTHKNSVLHNSSKHQKYPSPATAIPSHSTMQQRMTFTISECGGEGTAPLLKRATVTIANLSRSLLLRGWCSMYLSLASRITRYISRHNLFTKTNDTAVAAVIYRCWETTLLLLTTIQVP